MRPPACVSVCQAAWSTDGHTEAHWLSLSLLRVLCFPERILVTWENNLGIFLNLKLRLVQTVWTFCFPPVGNCLLRLIDRSTVCFSTVLSLISSDFLSEILGYAVLTYCDSPAIWTACLSTDHHMLPQHSSGKDSPTLFSQNLTSVLDLKLRVYQGFKTQDVQGDVCIHECQKNREIETTTCNM